MMAALEHGEFNSSSNDVERLKLNLELNIEKSAVISRKISDSNFSRVV